MSQASALRMISRGSTSALDVVSTIELPNFSMEVGSWLSSIVAGGEVDSRETLNQRRGELSHAMQWRVAPAQAYMSEALPRFAREFAYPYAAFGMTVKNAVS